jgi:HEAT repeat protein
VRVAVAEIIGKLDNPAPAVDLLIAAARADNPWTRLAAVTALDELGEQALAARPTLEKCLSDPNGYVSRVAARALEKAKTAKPVPAGM